MRGADKKLRLHPLFLLAGVLSALTGQLLVFLAVTFAALEHECAHAFVAKRFGYSLEKVVLMPYGAVVSGDLSGISVKEEILVCLAGPFANAATALFFVALWWLYPETYPYTDVAAQVSLSLFLVNLLPAFPLDGGRILRALLRPLGERRSVLVCRICGGIVAAALLGYFVYTCFFVPNYGALVFVVLLLGSFGGSGYRRLTFLREKNFVRGVEERRMAVSADLRAGEAIRFLRDDKYLVLVLFEGEEFCGELTEAELLRALEAGEYDRRLKEIA